MPYINEKKKHFLMLYLLIVVSFIFVYLCVLNISVYTQRSRGFSVLFDILKKDKVLWVSEKLQEWIGLFRLNFRLE